MDWGGGKYFQEVCDPGPGRGKWGAGDVVQGLLVVVSAGQRGSANE